MKLRKISLALLTICTIFAFVACNIENDEVTSNDSGKVVSQKTENAQTHEADELFWEGYEDMPFKELIRKIYLNIEEDIDSITVTVENGWNTNDIDDENADEPYSYVVKGVEGERVFVDRWFMDVNDERLLVVRGAVNDSGDFLDETQANRMLKGQAKSVK